MKRTIAIFLSLVMVLGLAAVSAGCSSTSGDGSTSGGVFGKKASIIGKWKYTMTIETFLEANGEEADEETQAILDSCDFDGVELPIYMEFDKENVKMYVSDDDAQNFCDSLIDSITDGAIKMMLEEAKDEGLDLSEDDILSLLGMTKEELKESMAAEMDPEDLVESLEDSESKYTYKDGKLYIYDDEINEDSYMKAELSSETLELTELCGEDSDTGDFNFEKLLPMTFERVK